MQIIHFWIAYVIIRYVAIQPIIDSIQKEDQEVDDLQSDISLEQKRIERSINKKEKEWEGIQESFLQQQELIPEPEEVELVEPKMEKEMSPDKKKVIANELATKIVERMKHVD